MDKTDLKFAKNRISERFLGKGGIHGVGMNRRRDVVCLYVEDTALAGGDLLAEIESIASPHRIEVIEESAARLATG